MNLEINPSNSRQLHTPMSHCKKKLSNRENIPTTRK